MNTKIGHLRNESTALDAEIDSIRENAADLNGSGLVLSQGTVNQLEVFRDFRGTGRTMDQVFGTILIFQHLAVVTRIRSVLDGMMTLQPSSVADHRHCELGLWLEEQGKTVFADEQLFKAFAAGTSASTPWPARSWNCIRRQGGRRGRRKVPHAGGSVGTDRRLDSRSVGPDRPGLGLIDWTPALEIAIRSSTPTSALGRPAQHPVAALQTGKTRMILEKVLAELIAYTRTHFHDEETLFLNSSYPGKEDHQAQHRDFVATVDQFQSDFLAGRAVMGKPGHGLPQGLAGESHSGNRQKDCGLSEKGRMNRSPSRFPLLLIQMNPRS